GHRADPPAGARARGADHGRGRLGRRLCQPRAAVSRHRRPARPRPEGAADGAARPLHRPRRAGQAVRRGGPRRAAHRCHRARRAGPPGRTRPRLAFAAGRKTMTKRAAAIASTVIAALIVAYTAGGIVVGPAMYSDAGWGFLVADSMAAGAPFNHLVEPDPDDIARDASSFVATWSPGQYVLAYGLERL